MTRKEAADIVREVKKSLKESADEQLENIGLILTPDMLPVVGNYFERQYEALDMAIEALERE